MKTATRIFALILITILLTSLLSCAKQDTTTQTRQDTSSQTKQVASTQEKSGIISEKEAKSDGADLNTTKYDFSVGANNINMNTNPTKMVTDGKYLYVVTGGDLKIYKCLISKSRNLNATINLADGGAERFADLLYAQGKLEAIGIYNNSLYIVETSSEMDNNPKSVNFTEKKTQLYHLDNAGNVKLDESFFKSFESGNIVGKWYYYTTRKRDSNSKPELYTLVRRSLLDGTVETIDDNICCSIGSLFDFTFSDTKLYYSCKRYINNVATSKTCVVDLTTGHVEESPIGYVGTIVGVYNDMLYYSVADDSHRYLNLMRIPVSGGNKELVVSSVSGGGSTYYNFAGNKLYLLWADLLYTIPLNQIGMLRESLSYKKVMVNSSRPTIKDTGIWLWADHIWTFVRSNSKANATLQVVQ